MTLRPIRTEAEYEDAHAEIATLWGAEQGTEDGDRLDVLLILVEDYERKNHPVPTPDPIEAIKIIMEDRGLTKMDLIPAIGSRSKVSEVMSKKRPLSLAMIRALHEQFKIPAEILIQDPFICLDEPEKTAWSKFPLKEIISRGWAKARKTKDHAEEIVREFFSNAGLSQEEACNACFRSGVRKNSKTDILAQQAWLIGARIEAAHINLTHAYHPDNFDETAMRELVRLSAHLHGPLKAQEYLAKKGIRLVAVRHFKRTYVDGAVFWLRHMEPVIALTLRHDRLDNFWFTLLHECSHLVRGHLEDITDCIIDDLDLEAQDIKEKEADTLARDIEIPTNVWMESDAKKKRSKIAARELARALEIHPAIVAGRIRYHTKNYKILAQEIGTREVRKHFWTST